MQPLIHPKFENDVPRHQIAFLRIGEGFVGVNGGKLGVQLLLKGVRDHQIRLALHNLIKNRDVILIDHDRGLLEVGPGKFLIGSSGINNHPDTGFHP